MIRKSEPILQVFCNKKKKKLKRSLISSPSIVGTYIILSVTVPFSYKLCSRTRKFSDILLRVRTFFWLGCKSRLVIPGVDWRGLEWIVKKKTPSAVRSGGGYRVPGRARCAHVLSSLPTRLPVPDAIYNIIIKKKTGSGIPSVLRLPSLMAFTFQMI